MYMCMSVLVPTCTVSAAQFFSFFSSRLLNRMRAGDEKHRNKNVWPYVLLILCRVHYLHRTIMRTGSCMHLFMCRVYSSGFNESSKSSKTTIKWALNSDKDLGGNITDWSSPGQRDRPRSNPG